DLAVQAALRRAPELRGRPLALTDAGRPWERARAKESAAGVNHAAGAAGANGGKGQRAGARPGRARVVVASSEAHRCGVRPGLTAAQAAAACPGLALLA